MESKIEGLQKEKEELLKKREIKEKEKQNGQLEPQNCMKIMLRIAEAGQNGDKVQVKRLINELRYKSAANSTIRTKIINKNLKTILKMIISPLGKYLMFSSKN